MENRTYLDPLEYRPIADGQGLLHVSPSARSELEEHLKNNTYSLKTRPAGQDSGRIAIRLMKARITHPKLQQDTTNHKSLQIPTYDLRHDLRERKREKEIK